MKSLLTQGWNLQCRWNTLSWVKWNPPFCHWGRFHPRSGFHRRRWFHPPARVDFTEKSTCDASAFFMVETEGFDLPCAAGHLGLKRAPGTFLRALGFESPFLSIWKEVPADGRNFFSWWRRRDSNPWPYGCEPYALPTELRPHIKLPNAPSSDSSYIITHFFRL